MMISKTNFHYFLPDHIARVIKVKFRVFQEEKKLRYTGLDCLVSGPQRQFLAIILLASLIEAMILRENAVEDIS